MRERPKRTAKAQDEALHHRIIRKSKRAHSKR